MHTSMRMPALAVGQGCPLQTPDAPACQHQRHPTWLLSLNSLQRAGVALWTTIALEKVPCGLEKLVLVERDRTASLSSVLPERCRLVAVCTSYAMALPG